jgi:polysaccharide biosynthesis transport protein
MSSKSPVPYDPHGGTPEVGGPAWGAPAPGWSPPPGPATGGPATSMVKRTLTAIWRFKWMILAITALGAGAGMVAMRFQSPVYESRARVWIGQNLSGGSGNVGPIRQGALLNGAGWQSLLMSSAVLDTVIQQKRLYLSVATPEDTLAFENFSYNRGLQPGSYRLGMDDSKRGFVLSDADGVVLQRGAFGDSAGVAYGFQWVPSRATVPEDRPIEFSLNSPNDVSKALQDALDVSQRLVQGKADENFLNISYRGADRNKVASTLDAVVNRFEQVALELKTEALARQREILNDQLHNAEQQLFEHESALQNFKVQTATLPMEDRATARVPLGVSPSDPSMFGIYYQLNADRDQLHNDQEAIRRVLRESKSGAALITAMEIIPSVRTSSQLTSALASLRESEGKVRANSLVFEDAHPQMRLALEERDSLLHAVIPNLAGLLLAEMQRKEDELDSQIASMSTELRKIPERVITEQKLDRQYTIAADLYKDLENRYQAARLAESITVGDLTILDRPGVSFAPVSDPRRQMLLMFLGGAFALALAAAVLRDRLDPRIQYPDQVTGDMGLNVLGAVPALRGGRLGPADMALAVEAFRSIQLSLTHAVGNGGPLTVTFTSPGASDGKSFVTSNLAIAFADMGHRTLVIDGDVRRGSMHKLLGASHKPGLTDFLSGRTDRGAVIQETRYPLLHFVGCGSRQESGPKLLGSPTMREFMSELRSDYDVILVDSPPLGACVDPMILATLTKNMVLVVRTGSTDRSLAESKLDAVDRLPVRVVGAVLNDVAQGGAYRYYSYVSGYEILDEEPEADALPSGNGRPDDGSGPEEG